MKSRHYLLTCRVCNNSFEDDGFLLECPHHQDVPALLVTKYECKYIEPLEHHQGLFRYQKWLPTTHILSYAGGTVTYQSLQLNQTTGLPHLWIAFNGYWPERNAQLETTTFKELEAYTVISRLLEHKHQQQPILVVSSAGNTAAAFASVCSKVQMPCLIILPESGLAAMHFPRPLASCVKLISLSNASYTDAIVLAQQIAQHEGFFPEGGVKNVARRDGLGSVLLNAVETIGRLPDYYFQAIGSGAGAIAVHDMAARLIEDGRFGQVFPRLMLSQNTPFAPIYHAWKSHQRTLIPAERNEGKGQIQQMITPVLSNQHPPYALRGGVFDVLTESQGEMLVADNQETQEAMSLFEETEGIDIHPAAGVALATLLKTAQSGRIDPRATILLNVTGGGWKRKHADQQLVPAQPTLCLQDAEILLEDISTKVIARIY
ncbi:MAG TPA: cysteate synthase [Ktedonobacteraceae bacterium]|nr:cysteate synthase [Ktedonobacteraceae bacterium]